MCRCGLQWIGARWYSRLVIEIMGHIKIGSYWLYRCCWTGHLNNGWSRLSRPPHSGSQPAPHTCVIPFAGVEHVLCHRGMEGQLIHLMWMCRYGVPQRDGFSHSFRKISHLMWMCRCGVDRRGPCSRVPFLVLSLKKEEARHRHSSTLSFVGWMVEARQLIN